jgi:hypothetical protein
VMFVRSYGQSSRRLVGLLSTAVPEGWQFGFDCLAELHWLWQPWLVWGRSVWWLRFKSRRKLCWYWTPSLSSFAQLASDSHLCVCPLLC